MRILTSILLVAAALTVSAQSGPWQLIVDGTPTIAAPRTITEGRFDIFVNNNFSRQSQRLETPIYDTLSGKFNGDTSDVFLIRFGFSYRVTPGVEYAEFALLADVGSPAIEPVKLGQWIESRPGVWRDVNPEKTVFVGDSVVANGARLYIEVLGGSVDVARFDVYTELKHDESEEPSAGITSLLGLSDVAVVAPQVGDLFVFNGATFVNSPGYVTDVIWAEENGGLVSNTLGRFSFGNGATGANTFGLPIWEDMEAVGMVVNAETAGASVVIQYTLDATIQPQSVTATGNTTVTYFPAAQSITSGQLLNFRTGLEVGTWTDVRVGLIVRKKIWTSATPSPP